MDIKLEIPAILYSKLWTKYLPQTTLQMYGLILHLTKEKIYGEEAMDLITNFKIKQNKIDPRIISQKKESLKAINKVYPKNKQEDLELLLDFKLIKVGQVKDKKAIVVNNQIKSPEEILDLPKEEIAELESIRFEMKYQKDISGLIDYLLRNNNTVMTTVKNILDTTGTKIANFRLVLDFLSNKEKSLVYKSDKKILNLKKNDKVSIDINKEVFNKKRMIMD